MVKKSGRDTKYLATRGGVTTPDLVGDDFAEDKAYHAAPEAVLDSYENALDLFPEEHPAESMAPAPVAAAPQSDVRRFAWNETDGREDEPRSPYYGESEAPRWSERARQLAPVVMASIVFVGVIAGVAAWVMSDIREAGVIQSFRPTESAAPPIRPRPQSWASSVPYESKTRPDPEPLTPPASTAPSLGAAAAPTPTAPAPTRAVNAPRSELSAPPAQKVEAAPERQPAAPRIAPAAASQPPAPPASRAVADASPSRPESTPGARAARNADTTSPSLTATNVPPSPVAVPDPSPIAAAEPVLTSPEAVVPAPRTPARVASAVAAAAPVVVRRDEDDVRDVLGRYRAAYSDLDAFAAREVWPTVDMKALSRAFDQLSSQNVDFKSCNVSVGDAKAVANCDGSTWYVPKVGGKGTRTDNRRWRFDLHKSEDGWTIDSVSSK